jgi:hypothetical protein
MNEPQVFENQETFSVMMRLIKTLKEMVPFNFERALLGKEEILQSQS